MVAAHAEGHAGTVVEDIAHMTIDNNMRKRRAVHMAKSPADDLGGLGESLRRIPSTEGEQLAGAFGSRRTESSREHMSISSTPPQVVHSANSSSADGTPVQWGAASPPATPGFAGEEAASTAPALFDALPAELVCAVAAALCTAPGIVAMLGAGVWVRVRVRVRVGLPIPAAPAARGVATPNPTANPDP
jgi:hypothetical protein